MPNFTTPRGYIAEAHAAVVAAQKYLDQAIIYLNDTRDGDFVPSTREHVLDNIRNALAEGGESLYSSMTAVAASTTEAAFSALQMGDQPDAILPEKLAKVNEFLPTDQLEQWQYLDVMMLCEAIHAATDIDDLINIVGDPGSTARFVRTDPVDMHARSVLTRTHVALLSLDERDGIEWFTSSIGVIREVIDMLQVKNQKLFDIEDAVQSDVFTEAAVASLNNKEAAQKYTATIDHMIEAIRGVDKGLKQVDRLLDYYERLVGILEKTAVTVDAAHHIYLENARISFT